MSLQSNVVVVNQFTNKNISSSKSYGKSPKAYIMDYMSRKGATEGIAPIRLGDENDYVMRYMAREDAVDEALSVTGLKKKMRKIQGNGGVAFGYGEFSLSHKKLIAAANDIQDNYDNGKTVMKTVLSFHKDYLQKHGVITDDFYPDVADEDMADGVYRGNIDQLKLRMAIMNGLRKLGRHYDDLQYVGVIQVDTSHVHCHLAMVDRGVGNLMPDGTQRGKITDKEKQDIRRGVDMFLDQTQSVKMMASSVEHDRRNTICFVKKYTHKAMNERGFSQFLLACLPENRNLWRASTNSQEMKKANGIVREYVHGLLQLPDSGYQNALQKVDKYARSRMTNEGLTGEEYRRLFKVGRDRIIDAGVNSVYSVLKQIPPEELTVRTPMLETMSMPYEDMASEADDTNPLIEFGFKLRSYKSRLDYHKKEFHKYHDAVTAYEDAQDSGTADPASIPLYEYFKIEEEYNAMLLSKYHNFLLFLPPSDEYQEDFDKLLSVDRRIQNLKRMQDDQSLRRMTPANAEEFGMKTYGETGGRTLVSQPQYLQSRLSHLQSQYSMGRTNFLLKLQDYGMSLTDDNKLLNKPQYPFDDVKSLDLHHLLYDFPYDIKVSTVNAESFVEMADRRYSAFQDAKAYLIESGQAYQLNELPEADISLQHSTADRFRNTTTLQTLRTPEKSRRLPVRTVSIDYDFYAEQEDEIKNVIKNTINSLQYD